MSIWPSPPSRFIFLRLFWKCQQALWDRFIFTSISPSAFWHCLYLWEGLLISLLLNGSILIGRRECQNTQQSVFIFLKSTLGYFLTFAQPSLSPLWHAYLLKGFLCSIGLWKRRSVWFHWRFPGNFLQGIFRHSTIQWTERKKGNQALTNESGDYLGQWTSMFYAFLQSS